VEHTRRGAGHRAGGAPASESDLVSAPTTTRHAGPMRMGARGWLELGLSSAGFSLYREPRRARDDDIRFASHLRAGSSARCPAALKRAARHQPAEIPARVWSIPRSARPGRTSISSGRPIENRVQPRGRRARLKRENRPPVREWARRRSGSDCSAQAQLIRISRLPLAAHFLPPGCRP